MFITKAPKKRQQLQDAKDFFKPKKTKKFQNQETNFIVVDEDIEQIDDSYLEQKHFFLFYIH